IRTGPATACAHTAPAWRRCPAWPRRRVANSPGTACASATAGWGPTGTAPAARGRGPPRPAIRGCRLRPALRRNAAAAPSPAGTARPGPRPTGARRPAGSLARVVLSAEQLADGQAGTGHAHQQQLPELGERDADGRQPALLRGDRRGAAGDERGEPDLGDMVARPELAVAFTRDIGV